MNATAPEQIHRFEAAGLGKAPFRFIGVETNSDRAALNREAESNGLMFTTNYCTSCDFCGMAINDAYRLQSADGNRFKVGCECVKKTGDAGIVRQIDETRKRLAREKRHAREAARIVEGKAWIVANRARLEATPHPDKQRAARGDTLASMLDWFFTHAGTTGRLGALRAAKKILGE